MEYYFNIIEPEFVRLHPSQSDLLFPLYWQDVNLIIDTIRMFSLVLETSWVYIVRHETLILKKAYEINFKKKFVLDIFYLI